MSREITALHPTVQRMAHAMISAVEARKTSLIVTCTLRTSVEQAALYAQGRQGLREVNILRTAAGLSAIDSATNNRKVTNAKPGQSYHEYGLAFDVVPVECGKLIWDQKHPAWSIIADAGKAAGLEWAGDWQTFKEYPHFQWTGGMSLSQLQAGQRPAERN